jgi:glutamyl-tRNA synthetase
MILNTRFAPSPTGKLHLGGARTALFNWLAASASGGSFILRIDDTDAQRSKEEYVDEIKAGLDWLGLTWASEYRQSERVDLYRSKMAELIQMGCAVVETDSSVRLDLPDTQSTEYLSWEDSIVGVVKISERDWSYIRQAHIARSGGMPLYNFVSSVDDGLLDVNCVIRGTDHISNTAMQSVIMRLLFPDKEIKYSHVGLIHGADGKKMSKREGDDSFLLSHYIDSGYLPEAMLNCLLRLGGGPRVDDKTTSVLTRDDAIRLFIDGGKMRAAPSKFDIVKLDSWNRKYKTFK